MGKRIRHLEFYGYADQNTYIGLPNADLSDIREVNKEQDKEINAISGATKEKADIATVNELSGKVETFIDKQDLINKWLAKGINKNRERIDGLERRDEEITNKINEIVDDFNPIYDELGRISRKTDELDTRLTEHIAESECFENRINNRVDGLEASLDDKLDKTEAANTFAKKSDVYTKREIDALAQNFATEQWVLNRGYITEVDADGKYASKARLNALEDRVGNIQTTLYNQYNELSSDLSQFKTLTNGRIDTLYGRMDTLESKCDREIESLTNTTNALQRQTNQNEEAIRQINEVSLPNKVDKSEFNDLKSRVNDVENNLKEKVDKTDYERDKSRFNVELDNIKTNKASKAELRVVSGAVDELADALEQEKQDRIAGDNALGTRIDETNGRIDELREENIGRDQRLNNLERDLTKEINDRVEADNEIIRTAKDYANTVANNALNEANAYTDIKDSAVRDYIDDIKADLDRQITAKADKSYVNSLKADIDSTIDSKVGDEEIRARGVETNLENALRQEALRAAGKENTISTALTHTSNIVKALTDWDGDDRIDYTDVGNGIIDVMHREVHDMKIAIANVSEGNKTSNEVEAAFGTYNVTHTGFADSEKTVFSVGIGTSDVARKNALEIRKNGDIYMWVNGQYVCINNLLAQLL